MFITKKRALAFADAFFIKFIAKYIVMITLLNQ